MPLAKPRGKDASVYSAIALEREAHLPLAPLLALTPPSDRSLLISFPSRTSICTLDDPQLGAGSGRGFIDLPQGLCPKNDLVALHGGYDRGVVLNSSFEDLFRNGVLEFSLNGTL